MYHLERKDLSLGQEETIQKPPPPLPPLTLPFLHLTVDLWHHHTLVAWKGPRKESKKQCFLKFYKRLLPLPDLSPTWGWWQRRGQRSCSGVAVVGPPSPHIAWFWCELLMQPHQKWVWLLFPLMDLNSRGQKRKKQGRARLRLRTSCLSVFSMRHQQFFKEDKTRGTLQRNPCRGSGGIISFYI